MNFLEGTEQEVVFVPMILPVAVFEFMNDAARKRGLSPGALINKIFLDKLREMAAEDGSSDGGE